MSKTIIVSPTYMCSATRCLRCMRYTLHCAHTTNTLCRETLEIAANLRRGASPADNAAAAEAIIQEIGIGRVSNNVIGTILKRGLSGGEKKRVTIGQVITNVFTTAFNASLTCFTTAFNALCIEYCTNDLRSCECQLARSAAVN
jgi:ABC-type hemin transport system ATPase subunit